VKSQNSNFKKRSFGLQTIEEKMSHLLKPIFQGSKKEFILINNLVKNWAQIVGPKYAKFCAPKMVNFEKNKTGAKLTISVFNSSVGFFLENNSDIIIERIATLYGFKSINRIIIKQEPKNIEMEQLDKKINDKNIEKMVDSTLENIENKELEATLKKLAEDIFGK
jgi:hypothetical protein